MDVSVKAQVLVSVKAQVVTDVRNESQLGWDSFGEVKFVTTVLRITRKRVKGKGHHRLHETVSKL